MSNTAQLDAMLRRFVEEDGLPGCGLLAAKDGKLLYEGYAGYANKEKGLAMGGSSVFRLMSMTKVLTCAAAMLLYERGRFLLHDPIAKYLPALGGLTVAVPTDTGVYELVPCQKPMTVLDALTMRCGLPYVNFDSQNPGPTQQALRELCAPQTLHTLTLQEFVKGLGSVPLRSEPGQHYLYGYGHDIIGALIEVLSGKTLGEFLRDELFTPLGMHSFRHFFCEDAISQLCTVYTRDEKGRCIARPHGRINDDYEHAPTARLEQGGAGLLGTLPEYLTFTQMLAKGGVHEGQRFLGSGTIDLMRKNQLTTAQLEEFEYNEYPRGYGYGLGVRTLLDPARAGSPEPKGAFGWAGYYGTYTSIDPASGFSLVFGYQLEPNEQDYFHLRVRNAAYGLL